VAYEVAQQLRAAGEEVRFLALVDAILPEWGLGVRFRLSQVARLASAAPRDVVAFISRRLRGRLRTPHAELMRHRGDIRLGPLEERRDAVNRDAAARYMKLIRPFSGRATMIAAGQRLRDDPLKSPSCGWSPHIPRLDVHVVDADHFRIMKDDPYVSEIANIVARQIRQADASARDPRLGRQGER
jgi:phthiocerol/phenolphthiocerol synthesis type-I polyketide synthase D